MMGNPFFEASKHIDYVTEENKNWFVNIIWFHPGRTDNCVYLAWYNEPPLMRNIRNIVGIANHFEIPYTIFYPEKGRYSAALLMGDLLVSDGPWVERAMLRQTTSKGLSSFARLLSNTQVNFVLGYNIDAGNLALKNHPIDKKWFFCVNMKE